MNITEALAKIKENWDGLKTKQEPRYSLSEAAPDCVWMTNTDHAGSHETDEEWLGIKKDGALVWAYASGCSCWDGEYEVHETHEEKEVKAFDFNHTDMKENWEKEVIKFAERI